MSATHNNTAVTMNQPDVEDGGTIHIDNVLDFDDFDTVPPRSAPVNTIPTATVDKFEFDNFDNVDAFNEGGKNLLPNPSNTIRQPASDDANTYHLSKTPPASQADNYAQSNHFTPTVSQPQGHTILNPEALALWENRKKTVLSSLPSASFSTSQADNVSTSDTTNPIHASVQHTVDMPSRIVDTEVIQSTKRKRKIVPTYYRKSPKTLSTDPEAPQSLWDRILQTLFVTLIYAVIGFLVDGLLYVVKAMFSTAPVSMFWLFLPILTLLGLILGWLMGGRALDALLIPFQTRDNPTFDEASFGYGMMKAIGLGLILAVIGWMVLMMFT